MTDVAQYAPKANGSEQLSDLSTAQVETYGMQAAEYVENHADDLERMIGEVVNELRNFAGDLRSQCQAQARRSEKIVQRVRTAAFGIRDLRTAFVQPLVVDDPVDEVAQVPANVTEQVEDDLRRIVQQFAPRPEAEVKV